MKCVETCFSYDRCPPWPWLSGRYASHQSFPNVHTTQKHASATTKSKLLSLIFRKPYEAVQPVLHTSHTAAVPDIPMLKKKPSKLCLRSLKINFKFNITAVVWMWSLYSIFFCMCVYIRALVAIAMPVRAYALCVQFAKASTTRKKRVHISWQIEGASMGTKSGFKYLEMEGSLLC